MRKITSIGLTIVCILTVSACAKQDLGIGRGGAEADLQTCSALSQKKKYEEAIECLEIYKSRYAGTASADTAELSIGDNFFRQKDFLLAAESYESFLRNHPLHASTDYAFYRLGLSYLRATPTSIDRDQEHLDDALQAFDTQLRVFPKSSHREETVAMRKEAFEKVGRLHYYIGRFYYRTGEYRAAIPRLTDVIETYPDLAEYAEAYYQLTIAYAGLQDFEGAERTLAAMHTALPENQWTVRAVKHLHKRRKHHDS